MYVYFYSLHVSDSYVSIIRRIIVCQYEIWYTSIFLDGRLVCMFGWNSIQTCIPDGHLHRVTYTICRTDTIDSPDDGHITVRNMSRIKNKHTWKRIGRQVGYLQGSYQDARLTKHKIKLYVLGHRHTNLKTPVIMSAKCHVYFLYMNIHQYRLLRKL